MLPPPSRRKQQPDCIPTPYLTRLVKICTRAELGVTINLICEAIRRDAIDPDAGGWVRFSHTTLAALVGITPDGVSTVMRSLLASSPVPLIEVRGRKGRSREYRVLLENFGARAERPARSLRTRHASPFPRAPRARLVPLNFGEVTQHQK
jgi:hypothetical protein